MKVQDFYLKIAGSLLSIIAASTVLILNYGSGGLTAAALIIGAALLIKSAEKSSRKTGRTKQMKTSLKASKKGGELLMIAAGLISYPASATATAAVISLLAFASTLEKDINDGDAFLGQEIRVSLLILAFAGSGINQYILFYGLISIGLVAAFDSAYMLYRSFNTGF